MANKQMIDAMWDDSPRDDSKLLIAAKLLIIIFFIIHAPQNSELSNYELQRLP